MTKNAKRVALYVRVSTDEQTTDNQRRELEAVAKRSGWKIVDVYEDNGISGANGREKRPALDKLLKDATRREFDMIAAWSVDRLGRSLQHLVGLLEELQALCNPSLSHTQFVHRPFMNTAGIAFGKRYRMPPGSSVSVGDCDL